MTIMIMNQILDPIKVDLKPNLLNIVNTHQPNPYKSGYNFYIMRAQRLALIHKGKAKTNSIIDRGVVTINRWQS